MIRFEGTLTPATYRRALTDTYRPILGFGLFLILVGVINLCFAEIDKPVSLAMPLFLILFGVVLFLSPRTTVKRAFATDRLLSELITGEADEQGVRLEQPHGWADLPWPLMHKVVLTRTAVAVYQSAQLLRIFPREFFTDEESWRAFRRLAAAAASARPAPSHPLRVPLLWMTIVIVVFVLWEIYKRT
jgi:hypothetical protein